MRFFPAKLGHLLSGLLFAFVCGFTATALHAQDAPRPVKTMVIENGETIITAFDYCGSNNVWYVLSYAWITLVVLLGGMIACMSLQIRDDLNDTRSTSLVLFLHALVVFVGILLVQFVDDKSDLMGHQSLILSLDVIFSILIYIVPKIVLSGEKLAEDPLPDVFVNTTICLTEIEHFAAWSSAREPVQVFKFLEEVYACIDCVAEKYHIFKVRRKDFSSVIIQTSRLFG